MKEGILGFVVLRNDQHYQKGDTIIFTQLDREGKGYAPSPLGRFATNDLTFTLGWMQQGGLNNGIDPAYAVFQLDLFIDPADPSATVPPYHPGPGAVLLTGDAPFPPTTNLRR
jgi:hypothetical protein